MSRISVHVAPDRDSIVQNVSREPEGERIRAELEDFLKRNKIVSILLDTEQHCVSVDIVKLPPEIKPVLTLWGSIFVRNDEEILRRQEEERIKSIPPVDRSKRCMTDGSPVTADHREIDPRTGMQKGYVALCPEERKKGFVRPVRRTYVHTVCGTATTMRLALAETYARDPQFYSGTMCVHCKKHFPLDQFVWEDGEKVGS